MAQHGDIAFFNGKLVSVADDSVLKVYKVKNNKLEMQSHIELPQIEHEPLAIGTNSIDSLFIGGKNKTVNIYTTGDDKKITKNTFEKPNLALKLKSDVKKIGFNGTKWLMGFSSDSHATLFNT